MAEMDLEAGIPAVYDEAYLAIALPRVIRSNVEAIRTEEELRAVIVHPTSPANLTPNVGGI